MFRTKMMTAALSAVCVLSSQAVMAPAASASTLRGANTGMHLFMGGKTVSFSLSNATGQSLNITVGEQAMTIEPGKTVPVKAAVGAKIVTVNDTQNHKAGEVLQQVSKDLSGATLKIG